MSLFPKKKPSLEELEEKKEYLAVETEVASQEVDLAERKATIKLLEKKYGSSWRSILGLKGKLDLSTLRSFLGGAKAGLSKMNRGRPNPNLNPVPGRELRR